MIYNIDFLIASLVFLLIILYHFFEKKSLHIDNNWTFLLFIVIGILNIFFDLLCTILITMANPDYAAFTEVCLMILYLLQILVPYSFLQHMKSQVSSLNYNKKLGLVAQSGLIFIIILIIFNHWSGIFFHIDEAGVYIRGPYYHTMYIFGGIYLLIIIIFTLMHASELKKEKVKAVWELMFFSFATVIIQFFYNDVLLSGFGTTLGITVLFFTINNPYNYMDNLTATFGIHYFEDYINNLILHQKEFHVLSIKLTQIKRINYIMGTDTGNQLLIKTADILKKNKQNTVFRITGNKFLIIVPSLKEYDILKNNILDYFSKPIQINDDFIKSPVIISGIINAQLLYNSNAILGYVDYLTSLSNVNNETRLIQGNEETLAGFKYNQQIETYLQTAIQQDLFEIAYQPVYSLKDQKFTTLEVLSRLRHPKLGAVSPDIFIQIAEKNDLIDKIGLLQLKKVCRFLVENPKLVAKLDGVKINLSPAELMKPGHADRLIDTIKYFNLPFSLFQFEITETVATEYSDSLYQIVNNFRRLGIGLCLDDFGSGYANINTVLKLPFMTIKLDRSLLTDICNNKKTASLYKSLVYTLHNLEFSIISEGIETKEEVDMVASWGVDMIQGYYFSKPLNSKDLLEKILNQE